MPKLPLLLAIVALLAAGCGSDKTETVTETVGADTGTETAVATDAVPTDETAEPGEGKQGPNHFETPSHNIGCYVSTKDARCDIRERTWKPTPEPASCKKIGLDYGQGIAVGPDHAEFVCAGDTSLGGPKVLAYGETSQRGAFACDSAEDGVTCTNVENGHGFFISRGSFRIF